MPLNRITFTVDPGPDWSPISRALTPWVDGERFADLIGEFEQQAGYDDPAGGYDGIECFADDLSSAVSCYVAPASGTSRPTVLLGCNCGITDCWPLRATIQTFDTIVVWREFHQPFRRRRDYTELGSFTFARADYEAALANPGV